MTAELTADESRALPGLGPNATCGFVRLTRAGPARWFLGASTEWPGVDPADVEIGNLMELVGTCPAVAAGLRAIAASVELV